MALTLTPLFRALRPHQWAKNLLLFVPLVLAHELSNASLWLSGFISFVCFSLTASAGYLLNDISDIESDRQHETKKHRPIASGALPKNIAIFSVPLLLAIGLGLSFLLPREFSWLLAIYFILSLSYSAYFKKILVLDVIFLAGFYALRILGGGMATSVLVSEWLLMFSLFFFLSLALGKRVSELQKRSADDDSKVPGRAYGASDVALLTQMGSTSGYLSVLVLALYMNSSTILKLYNNPFVLWTLSPILLYWITRFWLLCSRGAVNEDPVLFALRDKISYLTALLAGIVLLLAATNYF